MTTQNPDMAHPEKQDLATKTKRSWPLWKKLSIVGVALVVIIALAVGLGVGLTRGKGGDDNSDSDSSNSTLNARGKRWQPKVGEPWQIVLLKPIKLNDDGNADDLKPDVGIWDLDLYDNDAETFEALRAAGKRVICYFSAGSWEDWRDDKDQFKKADLGKTLDGWPDEKWLNLRSQNVRNIMKKRIKLAAEKGCDAIDPDNVDGYQNDNGLDLTEADAISYIKFLSTEAAKYNMSTGLKNAGGIISSVLSYVAFSVNEQCMQYSECETFAAFIKANKPVFNIEYPKGAPKVKEADRATICSHKGKAKGTEGFSTVIKKMNLDGWVMYCPNNRYQTELES
ncbi:endo alpha-14 polygalactosaminidase precursor [Fusarium albosuccineum]|uniref:alpha-galactosidase n=1 Tax=Fusarium albosuccineum TaxID=1237068 RepID=A0A8H4KP04_9HYPO|nr:endo alpha-14 polygalactosaminidase precursor [Fusarium albosuccineum]